MQERVSDLLRHPVGRPAHDVQRLYRSFRYQAASWSRPRRVVAKVERRYGELFPRVSFIVTNLRYASKNVVGFYNLRTLATPEPIRDWSLTSLREKLIRIGTKVVSHGRYVAFQMAEVAISRRLFAEILGLIESLRAPPIHATAR